MTTTLPPGTYFRFRRDGEWDYGRVERDGTAYMLIVESQVPGGEIVHDCVWTGKPRSVLESRRSFVNKVFTEPIDPMEADLNEGMDGRERA